MSEVDLVSPFNRRHYMCKHVNLTKKAYASDAINRNGTSDDRYREATLNLNGAKMALQKAVNDEINWN